MHVWETDTIKYLRSVERKDELANDLLEEKKQLEQRIYSVKQTGFGERVQSSLTTDGTERQLAKMEEMVEELAAALKAYTEYRIKIIHEIHNVPKKNHRMVLRKHYIEFKKLKAIADEENFSYSYLTRIHMDAIQSFWMKNKESVETYKKATKRNKK